MGDKQQTPSSDSARRDAFLRKLASIQKQQPQQPQQPPPPQQPKGGK